MCLDWEEPEAKSLADAKATPAIAGSGLIGAVNVSLPRYMLPDAGVVRVLGGQGLVAQLVRAHA